MDELPAGVLPFNSFSFNPNSIDAATAPTPIYVTRTASAFEVCNQRGIKVGAIIEMVNRINGSPEGIGSRWVILDVRFDIDKITIMPVSAKAGLPIRKLPLVLLKRDFVPVGLHEYNIRHL